MLFNFSLSKIETKNENKLVNSCLNENQNNENCNNKSNINNDSFKIIFLTKSFKNDFKDKSNDCLLNNIKKNPKDRNNNSYINSYNNNNLLNNNSTNNSSNNNSNNNLSHINFFKINEIYSEENIYHQNKRNRNIFNIIPNKIRHENIFKQVKVHTILFTVRTLNELLKKPKEIGIINKFLEFSKEINKEFKEKIGKSYNLENFEKTIKEILYKYYQNEIQKKDLKKIEDIIKKTEHENFKIIDKFLNLKFKELIQIYGMSNEEFEEKFKFKNKYLLVNEELKNKKQMFNLINSDPVIYLNEKTERTII